MSTTAAADTIAKALAEIGVKYLFGMPGGGNNLDVIGACEAVGIRFVLAHTETSAAIMATAWAELTGSLGACIVTRGPGAASAVNGAAQATQDRQPLLLICDTVGHASSPRIAHQNIDQRALFSPVTKWSTTLGSIEPDNVIRDAITTAMTPPRGAVHLDVDPDYPRREPAPPRDADGADEGVIGDLIPYLAAAQRPLIIVGVGARAHAHAVHDLIDDSSIPVMMTYKARGLVPDAGPNSAGTFTGARTDAVLLERADLILTIGLDSIELIPNPWHYDAPVLALTETRDPHRYLEPDVTVVGALDDTIAMLPRLPDNWPAGIGPAHRASITRGLLDAPCLRPGIPPATVVTQARHAAPAGSVATVDAGAHMLVTMPLWTTQELGEVLISSGLATMGYALPAAIGAALARPDVRVFCFVGDGGLQMCLGELETLARLRLNVTVVVFNDRTLSLIKAKQHAEGHGGLAAVQYGPSNFAAIAAGLGVPGHQVENEQDLHALFSNAPEGPVLLDVRVHPDAYRHVIDVVRNGALQ